MTRLPRPARLPRAAGALSWAVLGVAAAVAVAAPLGAQTPTTPAPADTAALRRAQDPELSGPAAAIARYNAPGVRRARGPLDVPPGDTIAGDLAVFGGPVTVAGHVAGRLTVVDGDLFLRPGASVGGDVLVVGGLVDGQRTATIGGPLTLLRRPIAFRVGADSLLAFDDRDVPTTRRDLGFRLTRSSSGDRRTITGVTLASAGTYNRAEGLPLLFGPSLEAAVGGTGRVAVDLLGIFRTADEFRWDREHLGHALRAEVRSSRGRGRRATARLYDEVAPVEAWQLRPDETGLATFALHRDFRDYYNRHGGSLAVGYDASPDVGLTLGLARERWASRRTLDPFTVLRNGDSWRPNPRADEGFVTLLTASARVDTRNDVARPWAGWYVAADYEYGAGRFGEFAPLSSDGSPFGRDRTPGRRAYGRGFVDLRRYNRLTPDAQLNFRLAAGGWLHGDPLPAERRLSVGGPGALAGYDFRSAAGVRGADVLQCGATGPFAGARPAGTPAECERVVLGQAEYRTDVRLSLFSEGAEGEPRFRRGFRTEFTWVLFADAGRGWLVGRRAGALTYPVGAGPAFSTFLTDVGAGVDFGHRHGRRDLGPFGVYVAKSVSRPDQAANVFVRVRRRF